MSFLPNWDIITPNEPHMKHDEQRDYGILRVFLIVASWMGGLFDGGLVACYIMTMVYTCYQEENPYRALTVMVWKYGLGWPKATCDCVIRTKQIFKIVFLFNMVITILTFLMYLVLFFAVVNDNIWWLDVWVVGTLYLMLVKVILGIIEVIDTFSQFAFTFNFKGLGNTVVLDILQHMFYFGFRYLLISAVKEYCKLLPK